MALDKLTQITSTGINSTTPLTGINVTGIITATSLSVSGITTGADATFNNLDVLGVVTYDDVTNVDSIGVVTARSGIHVTGGNVGIGTDNPGFDFHLFRTGDATLVIESDRPNTDENANPKLIFRQDGGANASAIGMNFDSDGFGNDLFIANSISLGSIRFLTGSSTGYTNATERMRITSDGSTYTGGSTITESDMNWGHDTYQRPHIFTGETGGNPSDGAVVIASPETDPSATRVGTVIFGCKTSSTTGVSNSGLKAAIDSNTNTNVSDAWKTGADLRFKTRPDNGNLTERLRITSEGEVLIGTTAANSFNGVGLKNNLIVAGSTSDTDITDNSSAAITISNKDGTAGNTAGLHFAREDTDGAPHYAGASIVTQFLDTQVTGQYPRSELVFLTSTAANNAPSEKMRIYASGAVTTPSNPLLKVNSTSSYGAYQSLHISPNVSIAQATAQANIGDTGWTTTGSNAYTFVCPVTGVYALHAHISLGAITPGNRVIWSMAYTLGGGNLPLSNYVEVIDTNVFNYQNASYFDTWYFTAGTRIGMGINSSTGGAAAGLALSWGAYLLQ